MGRSTFSSVRQSPYETFLKAHILTAFCIILLVWVYFGVPETKGVRIEEMDKLFGGNQGEADMRRIAGIRERLGIVPPAPDSVSCEKSRCANSKVDVVHCEYREE